MQILELFAKTIEFQKNSWANGKEQLANTKKSILNLFKKVTNNRCASKLTGEPLSIVKFEKCNFDAIKNHLDIAKQVKKAATDAEKSRASKQVCVLTSPNIKNLILFIRLQESGANENGKCQKGGEGEAA